MRPVFFHPDAQSEMAASARYYESQRAGLGKRFLAEIQSAIQHIELNPTMFYQVEAGIRRCCVPRFPCGIVFRETPSEIEILAILHFKRRPGYWKSRI
jgi:toxin ParE1/3/4